jgi:hypothetical protein
MTTGAPLAAFAEINAARSARRQIPRHLEVAGSDVNLPPQFAEMSTPARAYGPRLAAKPSTTHWQARSGPDRRYSRTVSHPIE